MRKLFGRTLLTLVGLIIGVPLTLIFAQMGGSLLRGLGIFLAILGLAILLAAMIKKVVELID